MVNGVDQRAWFALHVRSRHEKTVQAQLIAKKHEVFLPLYWKRSRTVDRIREVQLPLFPGYLFCRFDPSERTSLISTSGVIDLVRTGPDPAAISTEEIDSIQRIVASQAEVEPYPHLAVGDLVVLTRGSLAGLKGRLINVRNRSRFVVSVELLCRSVMLQTEPEWVVRCNQFDASCPILEATLSAAPL